MLSNFWKERPTQASMAMTLLSQGINFCITHSRLVIGALVIAVTLSCELTLCGDIKAAEITPVTMEQGAASSYASFGVNGSLLTAGWDQKLRLWENGQCVRTLTIEGEPLALSRGGRLLASKADDKTIKIWDTATGQFLQKLVVPTKSICAVVFSADGHTLATSNQEKKVKTWDVSSGRCLRTFDIGMASYVLAYSPDGYSLAAQGRDPGVSNSFELWKIWDSNSGRCLNTLHTQTMDVVVRAVAFSADGRRLATSYSHGELKIWDTSSGKCLQTLTGHQAFVNALAFSPDGRSLSSGGDDKTVKVWDVESGMCLRTLSGHTHEVYAIAYSPDGKRLVSSSSDNTLKIWDLEQDDLLCQYVPGHERSSKIAISPALKQSEQTSTVSEPPAAKQSEQTSTASAPPAAKQSEQTSTASAPPALKQSEQTSTVSAPPALKQSEQTSTASAAASKQSEQTSTASASAASKQSEQPSTSTAPLSSKQSAQAATAAPRKQNELTSSTATATPSPISGGQTGTAVAPLPTVPTGALVNTPIRDKWALIVGISHFANQEYNLKYASKDAIDFRNFLVNEAKFAPDHVKLLIDQDATVRNIRSAFGDRWLPRLTEPGDLVVVYLSTHGTPAAKDPGQKNYIVGYDTDRSDLYATGLAMDELSERIKNAVKSDRVLIVMDTCYSGGVVSGARGDETPDSFDAKKIVQDMGKGRILISSSSPQQRSWESKHYNNGVFTRYLINALRQNSGTVDVRKAFDSIREQVSWEVKRDFGASQDPQIAGEWQGNELILSTPATRPRPMGP